MNLPELPIPMPQAGFPFHVPEMIHPLIVHFAIALPFLILLLELVNLLTRKRAIGVTSFAFMVLLTLILYLALVTGSTDAQAAKETLSSEAKVMLAEHKQWAVYLFYSSVILMLIKLVSVLVRKTVLRVFFFLVLILFAAATLATGKRGGALVYSYGVNVGEEKASALASPSKEQAAKSSTKANAAAVQTEQVPPVEEEPGIEEQKEASMSEEKTEETKRASEKEETEAEASTEAPASEAVEKREEKNSEILQVTPPIQEEPAEEQAKPTPEASAH